MFHRELQWLQKLLAMMVCASAWLLKGHDGFPANSGDSILARIAGQGLLVWFHHILRIFVRRFQFSLNSKGTAKAEGAGKPRSGAAHVACAVALHLSKSAGCCIQIFAEVFGLIVLSFILKINSSPRGVRTR